MNVLFLSVSAGGGHAKAAEAIREIVEEKHPNSKTFTLETLKYASPIVDKLIVGSYLNTVKKTPHIYGKLYEMSENTDNMNDFTRNVIRLLSYKIQLFIEEFKPEIIVCTHPFPLQMMSVMKKKNKIRIPVVAIMTDYVSHSLWLHEHIDAYITAHDSIKQQMIDRGIPGETIFTYGIPVCRSFMKTRDRNSILKEFGLENKTTVLVMGGSLGFGNIKSIFIPLLNYKTDIQIVAISGKNAKLKRQLEKYSEGADKNVKILSFTNQVADLMQIADFLVSKPGGLTIAEALVKKIPMFLISPIPGQEEGNSNFLVNNGVAARILGSSDADYVLNQIMGNPLRVRHMKEMAEYLAKPNSSEDIVRLLESIITRYKT